MRLLAGRLVLVLSSSAVCLALARPGAEPAPPSAALAQSKGEHVDEAFGFKLKVPKDWGPIPMTLQEEWVVAKYLCDRSYFATDKSTGYTFEHKPDLRVIAFLDSKVKEKVKVEKKEDDKGQRTYILVKNPYKDYLDYLKTAYEGVGHHVTAEANTVLEGVPVKCYEITVDKVGLYDAPKRIVTWVYHTEEVDFATQFEVLEDAYPKLKKEIETTLKAFRIIPRTKGLDQGGGSTQSLSESFKNPEELPIEERTKRRKDIEATLHKKAEAGAVAGWGVFRTRRCLVLSHADEKYARMVAAQGEAVLDWLELNFPFVGTQEYVRQPILRVCKDMDELQSFFKGSTFNVEFYFGDKDIEVITYNDYGGKIGYSIELINKQLMAYWFFERDRKLWRAMPSWLRQGLYQVLGTARTKGSKLEFAPDDWEREGFRRHVREGEASPPRELMKMTIEEHRGDQERSWGRAAEAGCLVRYLLVGAGSKSSRTKDVLGAYVKALNHVAAEIDAEEKAKAKADRNKEGPKTEAEEEEEFKRQSQRWKELERKVIDQTFDRCFHGWTDKQWDDFSAAYFKGAV